MNSTFESIKTELSQTAKTNTILEITTSVLGIFFIVSEVLGKSKCKENSIMDLFVSMFSKIGKCGKKDIENNEIEIIENKEKDLENNKN